VYIHRNSSRVLWCAVWNSRLLRCNRFKRTAILTVNIASVNTDGLSDFTA